MKETLQNALKVQSSLFPRRKAVEQVCITSCNMTVHVTFSYRPESDCLAAYEMAVLLTQSLHGFPKCLAIILRIERWCRLHST